MPGRLTPIVTNEIYHVFNRGIDHRPTFSDKREFSRGQEVIKFYRFATPPLKFSVFSNLGKAHKEQIIGKLNEDKTLVGFISYCLIPNHFHFLLKQNVDNGIAKFMSNFQNSFTRYFNTKHKRVGPLFLDQFKAVRIETDEQLLHLSRYIHLNPYSSFVVKTLNELENYPWSSLPEFLWKNNDDFCEKDLILSFFNKKGGYLKFILDQADYQRRLEGIKHLTFER